MDNFSSSKGSSAPRSKKGCATCRLKKVKCDEQRPLCARCRRLDLSCDWKRDEVSLRDRRRGYRTVQSRAPDWVPKKILPAIPGITTTTGHDEILVETIKESLASAACLPTEDFGQGDDWWGGIEFDDDDSTTCIGLLNSEVNETSTSTSTGSYMDLGDLEDIFPSLAACHAWPPQPTHLLNINPSDHHISLPNSLVLSRKEHQALSHYQTTFSLYRTTKDPQWSTHKVLLHLGSQNAMLMLFLLAVSINDFALLQEDELPSIDAQVRFKAAAEVLVEAMRNDTEKDHVALMASFFFLYIYISKGKFMSPQSLTQLSKSVLDYVKRHSLDTRCLEVPSCLNSSGGATLSTTRERSVLARLIIWIFDEDLKCGCQGSGGYLAEYLTEHKERTMKIYESARNSLEAHWGADYPDLQVIDDIENSAVLDFLYEMMPLNQEIRELSENFSSNTLEAQKRIEGTFAFLEQKNAPIFRLSATHTQPRTRVLVNADFDVILFNGLRIYYFRSTILDLCMETPPAIKTALKTLISLFQRTFAATSSTELHDRLQWPLFLACIETDDSIYREWIISKLTNRRMKSVLRRTLDAQHLSGRRQQILEIRELFVQGEHIMMPASQFTFITALRQM